MRAQEQRGRAKHGARKVGARPALRGGGSHSRDVNDVIPHDRFRGKSAHVGISSSRTYGRPMMPCVCVCVCVCLCLCVCVRVCVCRPFVVSPSLIFSPTPPAIHHHHHHHHRHHHHHHHSRCGPIRQAAWRAKVARREAAVLRQTRIAQQEEAACIMLQSAWRVKQSKRLLQVRRRFIIYSVWRNIYTGI